MSDRDPFQGKWNLLLVVSRPADKDTLVRQTEKGSLLSHFASSVNPAMQSKEFALPMEEPTGHNSTIQSLTSVSTHHLQSMPHEPPLLRY